MPVEDINAEKMGSEFLNTFKSTEVTSEFWKNNSAILSIIVVVLIIAAIVVVFLFFAGVGAKLALKANR